MPRLTNLAITLGREVYNDIRVSLGADWDSLTGEQKDSIERTAQTYMELRLRSKAGEDVDEKLQAVESTITDWNTWGKMGADTAFWKGVQKVAETLGFFVGAAAEKFLGG